MPPWQATCLFVLLIVAGARYALRGFARGDMGSYDLQSLYQTGTLAINYFQFGAVRRGLGGSVAYLISRDPAVATNLFHCLSTVSVAAAATWLFRRYAPAGVVLRLVLALSVLVIMARWGDDRGRTDMAIAALLGFATIAFMRGRATLATLLVSIGLFIHESSFVFGLPLLLALTLQSGWSGLVPRQRWGMAAVLAGALFLYAGMGWLPHAGRHEIVEVIRGRLPKSVYVDWALYFNLGGMRGVVASICQNEIDPTYWIHATSAMVLVALLCVTLLAIDRRPWSLALLAALPGLVFLTVVANDISRWALFACFNVWLVAVTSNDLPAGPARQRRWRLALGVIFVPLVLYRPTSAPLRIYAPSPFLEAVARRLGGPATENVAWALLHCDPGWRDVLDQP